MLQLYLNILYDLDGLQTIIYTYITIKKQEPIYLFIYLVYPPISKKAFYAFYQNNQYSHFTHSTTLLLTISKTCHQSLAKSQQDWANLIF